MSQFTTGITNGDHKEGFEMFSYVTGPLDYAKTYLVKLAAVNNKGKLGNSIY